MNQLNRIAIDGSQMSMEQTNKDSTAPLLCFVDMHLTLHRNKKFAGHVTIFMHRLIHCHSSDNVADAGHGSAVHGSKFDRLMSDVHVTSLLHEIRYYTKPKRSRCPSNHFIYPLPYSRVSPFIAGSTFLNLSEHIFFLFLFRSSLFSSILHSRNLTKKKARRSIW